MSPKKPLPAIIPPPEDFLESFPPDQSARGNTTWKTLISSSLSAGIASCPPHSQSSCPSTSSSTSKAGFLAAHKHTQAELYYILSGRGIVEIEGVKYNVSPGMTVFIPGDAEHAVYNHGDENFRWLYMFPGPFEDVVYKFRCEGAYGKSKL
jgi:mannose-6-phosphate isomerase-like protein (cupin superfamily)